MYHMHSNNTWWSFIAECVMMIDTAETVLEEVCAPNYMKNKWLPTVYLILQGTYNN